jgi:NAD(P)-dependent dehydrogenase (short-subunit alcohol dehydrogenase family)
MTTGLDSTSVFPVNSLSGDSHYPDRVSDRAVLVTGASRGIGRAVADAFARAGDRVAVHFGQSVDRAEAVRAELAGAGHIVVGADLRDPDAVSSMVDSAVAGLGRLDVLVNNAGIFQAHPILETTYEQWQRIWRDTMDTNLIGAANVTWCAVRHMGPGGRIINVSSRGAFRGEPRQPAYGASKAGLNALTQSLAVALGPHGIAVAGVAPGFVDTDMAAEVLASPGADAVRAQSPFHRVGRPEEVAEAVLWLASPAAEWASGTIIDLNGASYLR